MGDRKSEEKVEDMINISYRCKSLICQYWRNPMLVAFGYGKRTSKKWNISTCS